MKDPFDLTGRVAMVTGASSGLGRHFAIVLARAGAKVVVAARRSEPLQSLAEEIRSLGGEAIAVSLDVTDHDSARAAVETADVGSGLDILVNNAGVALTKAALAVSEDEWDFVVDTNLKGVFLVAQEAARRMKERGRGGSIVNIASILGIRVAARVPAYAASKAGVVQLTKALALELSRDSIRVNALCPGYIETDLNTEFFQSEPGKALIGRIPLRRLGRADELDGALLLLCSDAGSFITGSELVVDGGHVISSL
ncbi:glucose 1-dehydrogenase [Hyphomicrobium sp.]|uniref:SDR family NAD(P)-dependent oxidoreductase n=1 Tax=Hyphomicrobium sp. TaxID=82 RepID=UPI0025BD7812|nr:glucose 1-dehydrogenase [Hyphomicrobium sp.]MCC7253975.1 glucose 1-dehydrogenase [Hyphomicrobium sp.]